MLPGDPQTRTILTKLCPSERGIGICKYLRAFILSAIKGQSHCWRSRQSSLHPKPPPAASPLERASRCSPSPCIANSELTKPIKSGDGRWHCEVTLAAGEAQPRARSCPSGWTQMGLGRDETNIKPQPILPPLPRYRSWERELLSGPQILCPTLDYLESQFWQGTVAVSAPAKGSQYPLPPARARGGAEQAGLSHGCWGNGPFLSARVLCKNSLLPVPTLVPHPLPVSRPFLPPKPAQKTTAYTGKGISVTWGDTLLSALLGWSGLFATEAHPGKCGLRDHQGKA